MEHHAHLKFTCPQCGGQWKIKEDAKLCHGMEPCTKGADCMAISHFGDCKSMPSIARQALVQRLLSSIDNLSIDEEYSPEFKNGFHRGVLAAHAAVKKALRDPGERSYWRRK